MTSDAHEGLKAAAAKVLKATSQRCRVHFMRNALAHANKTQRRMVSAAIATAFAQETAKAAREHWRTVADQFGKSKPKLAKLMDDAENEVLSYMDFPPTHWLQIHSTNAGAAERRDQAPNQCGGHLPQRRGQAPCCSSRTTSGA